MSKQSENAVAQGSEIQIGAITFNDGAIAAQVAEQDGERLSLLVMTRYQEDTGDTVIDTIIDGPAGTARRFAELVSDFKVTLASEAAGAEAKQPC